jgi:cytochrome c553
MSAPPHTRSWRIRRRVGVPVLLLSAATCAAVLAAQGASAGIQRTGTPANATQVTSSASTDERAEAFTTCMRSHGVPDFPGITISANGQIQLKGGSVNPISTTYRAAAKACASLLPTGSALPTAPEPPAPDAPTLTFTCDGDCPTPPKAPAPPS